MAPTVAPEFSALEVLGRILDGWKAAESKQTQNRFGQEIYARLQHVEATVAPLVEAPKKLQATLVTEIVVTEDMCQGYGTMHGGCTAYLIDNCSSLAILLLDVFTTNAGRLGVSQTLNITYHAPALPGSKLRIVSSTLTLGARSMSARTEIWDATHQRLVASGVHVKMDASAAKPQSKL